MTIHSCRLQQCILVKAARFLNKFENLDFDLYFCRTYNTDIPGVWRRKLGAYSACSKQWQFVALLSLCPNVSVSEVELQGQRKPPILCWKEMIIYHLVIHRDWVTRLPGRKAQRDRGRSGRSVCKII